MDSSRTACDIALLDLATGARTPLTAGRETHADAALSPDGSRILVGGARLRVYGADGALQREIVPPEGFDVPRVAWAPVGTGFAYVLGPAGFEPAYP